VDLVMLVVVGTFVPSFLLNIVLVDNGSPILASLYTPVELISTLVLSFIFLNDVPTWRHVVGGAILFFAILIVSISRYHDDQEKKDT
jgi:drug/metabolite transporter (DMT)-like permease